MRRLAVVMIVLAFCTQCTQASPPATVDGSQQTHTNAATVQKQGGTGLQAPGESSAQKAYIDPETGELTTPAQQEVPTTRELSSSARAIEPAAKMQEQPSPVPGGGTMIDLKGRFHNPLSATIEDDGQARIEHQSSDQTE